jgi:hypothetical protein
MNDEIQRLVAEYDNASRPVDEIASNIADLYIAAASSPARLFDTARMLPR